MNNRLLYPRQSLCLSFCVLALIIANSKRVLPRERIAGGEGMQSPLILRKTVNPNVYRGSAQTPPFCLIQLSNISSKVSHKDHTISKKIIALKILQSFLPLRMCKLSIVFLHYFPVFYHFSGSRFFKNWSAKNSEFGVVNVYTYSQYFNQYLHCILSILLSKLFSHTNI